MNKLAKFVIKYPLPIIITTLVITLIFAFGLKDLERESDIKKMMPENSVSVLTYNEIDEKFGGADRLIIIIQDDNVLDHRTLTKIKRISEGLKDIPGINQVLSITDMDEIKPVPDGIEVSPLLEVIPTEQSELDKFKHKILTDDKYVDKFVSQDGQAAMILAKLFVDRDNAETVQETHALLDEYKGPEKIMVSGTPEISQTIMNGMAADLFRLIPLVLLLVAGILFIGFRKWYGVILPLLTVSMSTIWSLGLLAYLGRPLTVIGSIIPVLLIAVGSAYSIHLIARFEEENNCQDKAKVLETALTKTGLAILIAAATTAVGFLSNIVSDITAIKFFGLITAFGIMSAFLLTVTFIPAMLMLLPCKSKTPEQAASDNKGILSRLLGALSSSIINKRSLVAPLTLALILIAAFGYPRLSTETDPVRYFSPKSPVVLTSELVKEKFGGSISLDLVFKGDLKDPELLNKIDQLQNKLEKMPILGKPYSIVNALKDTNLYLNNNDPAFDRIPNTRAGIAQYLLFLSMSGGDFTESLITNDHEEMLVSCRIATTRSTPIDKMIDEVRQEIKSIFPDNGVEIRLSGMGVIMRDMREMLISNQIQSLMLALVVVFFMILLVYRTPIGAAYCMVPILLTLLLNFGIMGWANIALDMATVLVSSIAVGMGIDYSVHFFNRYKEERKAGQERQPCIAKTMKTVGKPIIYNAASVSLGFMALIFSQFAIMRNFGILIALTMLFSSFGALAILPELLMIKVRLFDRRRKK